MCTLTLSLRCLQTTNIIAPLKVICHCSSVVFKMFWLLFEYHYVCLAIDFFLFILLGSHLIRIHWTSSICSLLFSITFVKFSAIISSNIGSAPLLSPYSMGLQFSCFTFIPVFHISLTLISVFSFIKKNLYFNLDIFYLW